VNNPDGPSKDALLRQVPAGFDTSTLTFAGLRGDARCHLSPEGLLKALDSLPPAPTDEGTVDLLVARTTDLGRHLPQEVELTVGVGLPGDRFEHDTGYGDDYQLATTRTDFARIVANGQPIELHGDNLFVTLDLSAANLPAGSRVRMGQALLEVTPQAHNGCRKWAQRFGLAPMRLNVTPLFRSQHLRGIYFTVIESGRVRLGDAVRVVSRG
jgi:hypothetical protein